MEPGIFTDKRIWGLVLLGFFCLITGVASIDCFKCVSVNGDNPACEDPFHNNFTSDILESPCMGGRKNRNGLFPATSCIKLAGVYADTRQRMIVRSCALDSGTLTMDTELVRMSHCGSFVFDGRYINGCLQSCDDGDGCNSVEQLVAQPKLISMLGTFCWLFHSFFFSNR